MSTTSKCRRPQHSDTMTLSERSTMRSSLLHIIGFQTKLHRWTRGTQCHPPHMPKTVPTLPPWEVLTRELKGWRPRSPEKPQSNTTLEMRAHHTGHNVIGRDHPSAAGRHRDQPQRRGQHEIRDKYAGRWGSMPVDRIWKTTTCPMQLPHRYCREGDHNPIPSDWKRHTVGIESCTPVGTPAYKTQATNCTYNSDIMISVSLRTTNWYKSLHPLHDIESYINRTNMVKSYVNKSLEGGTPQEHLQRKHHQ